MKRHGWQKGFTLIELLIVIVVIGILAAISIVMYIGVQRKARDTTQVVAVQNWQNVLVTYKAMHDNNLPTITTNAPGLDFSGLPGGTTTRIVCLGNDYPADDLFGVGQCLSVGGSGFGAVDHPFMEALTDIAHVSGVSMRKVGATITYGDGSTEVFYTRGIALQVNNPGDPAGSAVLLYGIEGGCPNADHGFVGDPEDDVKISGDVCIRNLTAE